jgi:hypothetical protein
MGDWDGLVRFMVRLSTRASYGVSTGAPRLRAKELILISLAGPIARRRHRPSSWRNSHGSKDHEKAADLAFMVCGSEASTSAFLRWMEIRTEELVIHWEDIESVAHAASVAGQLDRSHFLQAAPIHIRRSRNSGSDLKAEIVIGDSRLAGVPGNGPP